MNFQAISLGFVLLFALFGSGDSAGTGTNCNTKRPALTSGQTYTVNQDCTKGTTYDTATTHCHCWSYCGYICDPKAAAATTTTKAPTKAPTTAQAACKKPTVPSGSYWVDDQGCKNGNTYNTGTNPAYHCHCWGHCGYICDPKAAAATTTTKAPTKAPTTAQAACSKKPAVPAGSHWVDDPGCKNGNTYNTPTNPAYHCHCWGHCGYICDPKAGGGNPTTTKAPTKATTAATNNNCPFGSPWVPPNDTSYRCICQSFNHVNYYKCTPSTAATTTAASVTTGGTGTTAGVTTAGTGTTAAVTTDTAATTAAATTGAVTTAAVTTAGTTAAATTAAATTAAVTTAAVVTTPAITTPAVTTPAVGRR